ncbi:hypothetical protein BJ741DRAFT_602393 [Chytriomyces cf. hyalinus JEL632]|nr:hypothetical protein BJ741DRAFT_602393 [Chytriomyces cf. hyalinus JEL632]
MNRICIVITSSAIPSHPSDAVLSTVITSMRECLILPPQIQLKLVLVFDGFSSSSTESAFKRSKVTETEGSNYNLFIEATQSVLMKCGLKCWSRSGNGAVDWLAVDPSDGNNASKQRLCCCNGIESQSAEHSPPLNAEDIQLEQYLAPSWLRVIKSRNNTVTCVRVMGDKPLGQAIAMRAAMKYVDSEYVFACQHDWRFNQMLDVGRFMRILDANKGLNYLGFVSRRTAGYAGQTRPAGFPASLLQDGEDFRSFDDLKAGIDLPFCRSFFWFDKNHIARTSFYNNHVFSGQFRFKRGDFIEDTMGHVMLDEIKAAAANVTKDTSESSLEVWKKWGTILYYPDNGSLFTLVHVNGRLYMSQDARKERERQGRSESE